MKSQLEDDLAEVLHTRARGVAVPPMPGNLIDRGRQEAKVVRRRNVALTCTIGVAAVIVLAGSTLLLPHDDNARPGPAASPSATASPAPMWAKEIGFPYIVNGNLYVDGTTQPTSATGVIGAGGTYLLRSGSGKSTSWQRLCDGRLVAVPYLSGLPSVAVSPDGSRIAFVKGSGARSTVHVYVVATGTEVTRRVTDSVRADTSTSESADRDPFDAATLLGFDAAGILYWTNAGTRGAWDDPVLLWAWDLTKDTVNGPFSAGAPAYQAMWLLSPHGPILQSKECAYSSWRLGPTGRLTDQRPVPNIGDPMDARGVVSLFRPREPHGSGGQAEFFDIETGTTITSPSPAGLREQIGWGLFLAYDDKYAADTSRADHVALWRCSPAGGCHKLLDAPGDISIPSSMT